MDGSIPPIPTKYKMRLRINMKDDSPNYVNHIALVIDESYSMLYRTNDVIKVADAQIAYLARRSQELDQETRVTIYVFSDKVRCVVYDKDVLRLPSIAKFYKANGNTALIDATIKSQKDLALTPEIYGDHAFLTFVLTDGEENCSYLKPRDLASLLEMQPDHWTVAVLVPDAKSKHEAKKLGFPADNIAIWDTTTKEGLFEAGEKIKASTDAFMAGRAKGIRGSRSIFSTGVDAVNKKTVKAMKLKPLDKTAYDLFEVNMDSQIRPFIEDRSLTYILGRGYYQLTKTESIQPQKLVAVMENKTGNIYLGREARDLVGLPPDVEVRVRPKHNPDYTIFVQSTSVNRKLIANTKLLWLY